MNLTASTVARLALEPGKTDCFFWDDTTPGFGVRLQGSKRVFVFQFKAQGKSRRITLGNVAAMPLAQARSTAADYYAKVRLGQDPAAERDERRAALTLGGLVGRYLDHQRNRGMKPKTLADVTRYLNVNARPLHNMPVEQIIRRDVAALLAEQPTQSVCHAVRVYLSSFFAWAIQQGLAESNPTLGTAKPHLKPRERVLSMSELAAIWKALPVESDAGAVIRLLALTGARKSEIADLLWSDVSDEAITVPAERSKNKRTHVIPLSVEAKAILAGRVRHRDRVFAVTPWGRVKSQLDAALPAETPAWVIHDIRRSVATHMGDNGVLPHIIEACLNHVSGHKAGVAGIYNKAVYLPERIEALSKWANHLEAVVKGEDSNVIPLRSVTP
jgi:integrase